MSDGSLPEPAFSALVRPYTGNVHGVLQPAARGYGSDFAAVIECEKGPFFVKAVRNRSGGRRDSIVRERLINPVVSAVSPALRWHAEDDEWIVLGFEAVTGRSSDFEPGSPDLPAIVGVLNRIAALELPDVAQDWHETRWDRFALDEADAALFRGESLLYTDINPNNLMIGERGAWAVDWSWPTRGAAFIDPACLVVQLVSAGHSATSAESWAAQCTAWRDAEDAAIDAFAAASLRMYRRFAARRPDETWLTAMAEAAHAWAGHRGLMRG